MLVMKPQIQKQINAQNKKSIITNDIIDKISADQPRSARLQHQNLPIRQMPGIVKTTPPHRCPKCINPDGI